MDRSPEKQGAICWCYLGYFCLMCFLLETNKSWNGFLFTLLTQLGGNVTPSNFLVLCNINDQPDTHVNADVLKEGEKYTGSAV